MRSIHSSKIKINLRQLLVFSIILALGFTTVSCGIALEDSYSTPQNQQSDSQDQPTSTTEAQTRLSDGTYPVQQVTYDDAVGEYSAVLLNTAPGQSSMYHADNLPMARLTDEEISKGQGSYLKVEQGQPSLHITEDFKIEYVHNVTQTVTDPASGQPQTVVVQRDTSFWAPFAGALAGQALGSLLFTPHYYFPPVYQPGGLLVGYGSYGRTYDQAVNNYRTRYQAPPAAVRNRQAFRTTGQLRSPGYGQSRTRRTVGDRATGSGYGTSTLRRNRSTPNRNYQRPSSGFGSTRSRGSSRRRR